MTARARSTAIDHLAGPEWYAIFKDLHAGLIFDLAGNQKEAGKRLERAYKLDSTALRVVQAYGSWLSRNRSPKEAHDGFRDLRQDAAAASAGGRGDGQAQGGRETAAAGRQRAGGRRRSTLWARRLARPPRRRGPRPGLSAARRSSSRPIIRLRCCRSPISTSRSRSRSLRSRSTIAFRRVLRLHRNAAIQMAANLDSLDRADEAQEASGSADQAASGRSRSDHGARQCPARAQEVCRMRQRLFARALPRSQSPRSQTGSIYYFRGICYERSKQWAKAEADLKKALELFPDQPHVLNYLGYSWIDQGINLDEGMEMIKKAVAAASR